MTIPTDAGVQFFEALTTLTDGSTSTVADAAFSVAADITTMTNTTGGTEITIVMELQWDTTAPDDGSFINVFAQRKEIDTSADHEPVPSDANRASYIGSMVADGAIAADTDTFIISKPFSLPAIKESQKYDFYIENLTGQTIGVDWVMKGAVKAIGPKA